MPHAPVDKIYNLISCHSDAIVLSHLRHVKRDVMQVICLKAYVNMCMSHMLKKSLKIPKWVIRIRKSKKNRQHNGQKKKYKKTNNDL